MLSLSICVVLSIFLSNCLADNGNPIFLGPPGIWGNNVESEQTWFIGDEKLISWNGTWAATDLNFQASDSPVAVNIGENITDYSYTWFVNVSESQSPSHSQYFFFYLVESANQTNYVASNMIRVIQDPGSPTVTTTYTSMSSEPLPALATSTKFETEIITLYSSVLSFPTTTSDTAEKSSTTGGTASTPATQMAAATNGPGVLHLPPTIVYVSSKTGEKLILGVAIPLGALALISLAALAWRCHSWRQKPIHMPIRKPSTLQNKYKSELDANGTTISEMPHDEYDDNGVKRVKRGVSEMSGWSQPSEMDADTIHVLPHSATGDFEYRSLRQTWSSGEVSPLGSPRMERLLGPRSE